MTSERIPLQFHSSAMTKTRPGNTLPRGVANAAQKASFSPHAQQRPSRGDIGVDVVLMASPSGERITKRDVVATESARVSRGSGMPLKAFGNWRAKFKAEPQPPVRKLLYRRGGLSHRLKSHPKS